MDVQGADIIGTLGSAERIFAHAARAPLSTSLTELRLVGACRTHAVH